MSNLCALPTFASPPNDVDRVLLPKLEKKILRRSGAAIHDHGLIEEGDRILVALSGGKDSWALLEVLTTLQKRAPIDFELHAVTVDPGFPDFNPDRIADVCEQRGIPHHVLGAPIDRLVREQPEATPCIICSRLRRGVLYSFAKQNNFTKIALGHHLDDLLETLLLNLFFGGKLAAMPLNLISDDGANRVIRPLGTCEEEDLRHYAWLKGFPIVPCGCPLCGCTVLESRRKQIKALLGQLQKTIPQIKASMLSALSNVQPSHLLGRPQIENQKSKSATLSGVS